LHASRVRKFSGIPQIAVVVPGGEIGGCIEGVYGDVRRGLLGWKLRLGLSCGFGRFEFRHYFDALLGALALGVPAVALAL
jgi:hypothetical protein